MTLVPRDLPVLTTRSVRAEDRGEIDRWLAQPSVRRGLGVPEGPGWETHDLKTPEREWIFLNTAGTRVAYVSASECDVAEHGHGCREDGHLRRGLLLSTVVPEEHRGNRYGQAAKIALFGAAALREIDLFCFHIKDDHCVSRRAARRAGLELVGPAGQRDGSYLYYRHVRSGR